LRKKILRLHVATNFKWAKLSNGNALQKLTESAGKVKSDHFNTNFVRKKFAAMESNQEIPCAQVTFPKHSQKCH